jgi:hypothetical protein
MISSQESPRGGEEGWDEGGLRLRRRSKGLGEHDPPLDARDGRGGGGGGGSGRVEGGGVHGGGGGGRGGIVQETIGVNVLQGARGRHVLDWRTFLQVDLNPKS